MDVGFWVIIGTIAATIVLLWIGATEAERRYQRMHLPDDYDGMREDHDEQDTR